MDLRIEQADDGTWRVLRAGVVIGENLDRDAAVAAVGELLNAAAIDAARLQIPADEGALLPDEWVAPILCESGPTGPDRDFTGCVWTARDPDNNLVPLMLSTTTEMGGHIGARLAGFFTEVTVGDRPSGRGRFFANEAGVEARDLLAGAGRFGVSVDPSENVEYRFECVEMSDDGWCEQERIVFEAYEIGGATMTPFPGFENAYVQLASAPVEEPAEDESSDDVAPQEEEAVAASGAQTCCDACAARQSGWTVGAASGQFRIRAVTAAGAPVAPPAAWFQDPQFDRLTPLTITDEGRVFGTLAPWGQCHTGSPQGDCVVTPRSLSSYAHFRTGYVVCDDGTEVPTGRLTLGGGHASLRLSHRGAIEHYDNAGAAIADLACGEDQWGVWVAGALRPGVTDEQIRAARASSPSGDWRPVGAGLELVAALCVNQPGFPIARVASGRVQALVAAGAAVMARVAADPGDERISRIEARLASLHAAMTAPARAQLGQFRRDLLLERLRG
jgi:hypothetical protein